MSFPRYERYKDSGVDWLGEVPEHWQIFALKRIANLQSGETIGPEAIEPVGEYPVYGGNGLRGFTSTFTHNGNHALIGRQGALCGNVNYASGEFWASEHAIVVTPIQSADTTWLGELLREMNLNQYSIASAQPGLSVDNIRKLLIAVPTLAEQQAIGHFLRNETAKIDALIEEQRRLIDLLKEKRQAVISHAVTGETSSLYGWSSGTIAQITTYLSDGAHVSPVRENGIYPFVSTTNVDNGTICFDNVLLTSEESYRTLVRYGCQPQRGDILFSKDGTIGKTVLVQETANFVVASSLIIIRLREDQVLPGYLDYALQSKSVQDQVMQFVRGAGLPRLSVTNLSKVRVSWPSIDEQRAIKAHLDAHLGKLRAAIDLCRATIELLTERRSALISAAVTGKIDVRKSTPKEAA